MSMIMQVPFYIPDDIAVNLATGKYEQFGGVIRIASGPEKGQIVKMLEEANGFDKVLTQSQEALSTMKKSVFQLGERQKRTLAIVIAGVAVTGIVAMGGIYMYKRLSGKYEPRELKMFKLHMNRYIDAIRYGKNSVEIIDELLKDISVLQNLRNYKDIELHLKREDFQTVLGILKKYTESLHCENVDEVESGTAAIYKFEKYLNMQRKALT